MADDPSPRTSRRPETAPPASQRPETARPAVRRLGTAALMLAAIAIGGAISSYAPGPDVQHRPFVRTGEQGERVDARAFEAELLGVRGGALLTGGGVQHKTNGVWVIAKVRVTAKGEATGLGFAALRDGDDRIFRATGRIDQPLGSRDLQPGIPVDFEFVFEVPKNVPLPLAVRLAPDAIDNRMDGMAELELSVTREDLTGWVASTQPLKAMKPTVVASGKEGGGS